MKLRDLELVGPEYARARLFDAPFQPKTIAAIAVDIEPADLVKAAHVGRAALDALIVDAFQLLQSGAKVAIDKWLTTNGGQGTAISVTRPQMMVQPAGSACTSFWVQVLAVTGVQNFSADDAHELLLGLRRERGTLFG